MLKSNYKAQIYKKKKKKEKKRSHKNKQETVQKEPNFFPSQTT